MIKDIDEPKEKINELTATTVTNENLTEVADRIKSMEDDIIKFVEENYTELTGDIAPCYSTNDHLHELIIKIGDNKIKQLKKMNSIGRKIKQFNTIISLI